MAQPLPHNDGGGPLSPVAAGNDGDAPVERTVVAVAVGAKYALLDALSLLIESVEGDASDASLAEQEDAAISSSPPQQSLVADTSSNIDNNTLCDFANRISVNEFYPVQDGRSNMPIRMPILKKLDTDAEKDSFCRRWRMCKNRGEHAELCAEMEESIESRAVNNNASNQSLPPLPGVRQVTVDYNDKTSINKFYPTKKDKSSKMIPKGVLKKLDTDAEKHTFCLQWRECTTAVEQKALQDRFEAAAAAQKKAAKVAKTRDARMKKRRKREEKANKKRKKEEESAANKRAREIEKAAKKRQKRAAEKEKRAAEKENAEPINGLLSTDKGRERAEAASRSSKTQSSKRRSVKDAPKSYAHLYDGTVQRLETRTMETAMKFRHATTFPRDEINATKPLVSQSVISVVEVSTPAKSGGKRKRQELVRDEPKITIACTTGESGLDPQVQEVLYKSGALNHIVGLMKRKQEDGGDPFDVLTDVPSTPQNVTKINSKEQLDNYNSSRRKARARASTGRTAEQVEEALGDDFMSWTTSRF